MSSRFEFIKHRGKKIFYLNLRDAEANEIGGILNEAKKVIAKEPPNSVRHLSDVTDHSFSRQTVQELKDYANHNDAFIYRSAAIGVTGISVVLFNAVVKFSKRKNLVLKGSLEEALDWLAEAEK